MLSSDFGEADSTSAEHPRGRLLRLPSGYVAEVLKIDEKDGDRYFRIVVLRTGQRRWIRSGRGQWINEDGGQT